MEPLSRSERAALCNSALEAGETAPTLCGGWSVKDLVVHLLMPYELSVPRFLGRLAAAGFRFDTMAEALDAALAAPDPASRRLRPRGRT